MNFYGNFRYEHVHPLQAGVLRRKIRSTRRPGLPQENPFVFYPRRLWETLSTLGRKIGYFWRLKRQCERIRQDPAAKQYTDLAIQPMTKLEEGSLQINDFLDPAKILPLKPRAEASRPARLVQIGSDETYQSRKVA